VTSSVARHVVWCNQRHWPLAEFSICGCGNVVSLISMLDQEQFLPTRRYASTGTSHGPVSVCLSQVGVLLKWLDESSWFLAWELPSTCLTLC